LFAWLDRYESRDVQDIRRLLETYADTGVEDRLYVEEAAELELVGHDIVLAGAFLLGKDAQSATDESVRGNLATALSAEKIDALVQQMARSMSTFEDRTEPATALLRGFFRGLGLGDPCNSDSLRIRSV
jgi:predicted nucleotidyltransferase